MSSTVVNLCVFAILLAVAASQVQARQPKDTSVAVNAAAGVVRGEEKAPQESPAEDEDWWHVHGEKGHQWRWLQDDKGQWQRKQITDEEAKEAEPPKNAADNSASNSDKGGTAPTQIKEATKCDEQDTKMPVNIDVYYESKCKGCLLFMNQTLEPMWRSAMKNHINITMYTFGNGQMVPTVNISEGYRFFHPDTTGEGFDNVPICQHGPDECFGNLVEVCANHVADDKDKYMEFVFCMTSKTIEGLGSENAAYTCLGTAAIDTDKVKTCVTTPQGHQLTAEAARLTAIQKDKAQKDPMVGTPWVMVGGAHVENEVLINGTLLSKAVCGHVCNAPDPCAVFKDGDSGGSDAPAADDTPKVGNFPILSEVPTADGFIQLKPEHI